eukprot:jgi/Hompol1/904/HPOL_001323-RA
MRFIAKDLADTNLQFDQNTILIELEDGFYAPITDRPDSEGSSASLKTVEFDLQMFKINADKVQAAHQLKTRIQAIEKAIMEHTQTIQSSYLRLEEMRTAARQRRARVLRLQNEKKDDWQSFLRARDGLALTRNEQDRDVYVEAKKRADQRLEEHLSDQRGKPVLDTQMYICNVKLPNTNYAGNDDDRIATALGFTAHFITVLAYYLDVPLRYYILPISSRSTIWDVVFPLFARGSDRVQFEYAVFLINKNVEQLLNCVGKPIKNLRNTLPNLKLLCDTISNWPV